MNRASLLFQSLPEVAHTIPSVADLVAAILPAYALGGQVECSLLASGVNDTYLVSTPSDRFILRVYRAQWRELSDIRYEMAALHYLRQQGVAVSTPIAKVDGTLLGILQAPEGPRPTALFTYAPGTVLDRHKPFHAALYGRALAKLHLASDNFKSKETRPPLDLDYLIEYCLAVIQPHVTRYPTDWQYMQDLARLVRIYIEQLIPNGLTWGFCHGDCHPTNAHLGSELVITFFDFDCCAPGWRAYDLAIMRWAEDFYQMDPSQHIWLAFIQNYCVTNAITEQDLASIPAFVVLREIWHTALVAWLTWSSGSFGINDAYFSRTIRLLHAWETNVLQL